MFAAFIILLPAGILTANLFSRTHARQSWWFYTHAVLTGLGSLAGVVGLGIGLVLMVPTYYAMIHRWIGISIIIAIVIQVCCALWLPNYLPASMMFVPNHASHIGRLRSAPSWISVMFGAVLPQ